MTRERPVPQSVTSCTESRLAVPGMHCAGCIAKIEHGLAAVSGIASARVDFGAKQVRIAHVPELSQADLVAAMAQLGFTAHPLIDAPSTRNETRKLLRALGVAGFGAMNIMLLSVSIWSGAAGASREMFHWLSAVIALPTIAYAGRPFFASAWRALRVRQTNMDVPISVGVLLTTAMSLYETITHGAHVWFDSATMLLFFLLAGRTLDATMRARALQNAQSLTQASAAEGSIIDAQGVTRRLPATEMRAGMMLLVAAGERFAADGIIEAGTSQLDTSIITGESAPRSASVGDRVVAGMLNLEAPLTVAITAAGEDRTIAQLARIMADASQSRAKFVRIADRVSRIYAPVVHILAALSFAGWMIAGAGWHEALLIAVAVLIITCPCALGLAVPVAQVVAVGRLMKNGVLVKDGSALERLAKIDRALFDKTGTLTMGQPQPVNIAELEPQSASIALALAQASRHPLSRGLAAALAARNVQPALVTATEEVPGVGMTGYCAGHSVALTRAQNAGSGLSADVMIDDHICAHLSFADPVRQDAAAALEALAQLGVVCSIISGDNSRAVAEVALALSLTAHAGAHPEDKIATVRRLQAGGAHVLMVGDGLNDGPALAAANVSMVPSSASDVGQQAADLVFLGDGLSAIPLAIRVARRTQRIVRQNVALAIGYNVLAVPLAMAGQVTPLVAAVAMSCSSLIVVGNSLRLLAGRA